MDRLLPELNDTDAAATAIDAAVKAGKIAASEAAAYRQRYDRDPAGTERLLARLASSHIPTAACVGERPRGTGLLPELTRD